MRFYLFAFLLFSASLCGHAQAVKQDVVSPGGGYDKNSFYSLEWTIGETVATTFNSGDEIYTQGFNQSFLVQRKGNNKERIKIFAAPNPVTSSLTLSIESVTSAGYRVALTDLLGVKVYQKHTTTSNENMGIDMHRLAGGVYLLQVFDANNTVVGTIKLVKL